jgi:hypothetical protein
MDQHEHETRNKIPWEENPEIQKAQWTLCLIGLCVLTVIAIIVGLVTGKWIGLWIAVGVWLGFIISWGIAGVLMITIVTIFSGFRKRRRPK